MSVHDPLTFTSDGTTQDGAGWAQTKLLVRGPAIVRLKELLLRQLTTGSASTSAVDVYLTKTTKTAGAPVYLAAAPTPEQAALIATGHVPTASATTPSLKEASLSGHEIRLEDSTEYAIIAINRTGAGTFAARAVLETS